MIVLGTLQPDGGATLTREEVAWLREVFARFAVAYHTTHVSHRSMIQGGPPVLDAALGYCRRRLGELVGETAPAEFLPAGRHDPAQATAFDTKLVGVRAMVVRGGFPHGEPVISRMAWGVSDKPPAALEFEVPGAWCDERVKP